ncbi:MAG: methyltransferase domain-containing protein [Dehalococcoidia bacterium]|nr:methyltransferase domain-containing protein [Dehalococcoidia bacterium]
METPPRSTAFELFAPIAGSYERWATVLSLGQDPRWRGELVARLELPRSARVLDVATGTGTITRLLERRGARVVATDQSAQMLARARAGGATTVLGTAEQLPFASASFDAVTFSYLLRYVQSPAACMAELVRVLRPGGTIGMLEFGRPRGPWGPWWRVYTRLVLPAAGAVIGSGWGRVGAFLGPSIDAFHAAYPPATLAALWTAVGLVDVRMARRSLGGGLLMWARRP